MGKKRHFALAALSFPLVLSVLVFLVFVAGCFLGIVPIACGAPLDELMPAYFAAGLLASIALSGFVAVRFHRWLTARGSANA